MSWLTNDSDSFVDDMIHGFVAASSRWVQRAPGGVVRATRGAEPTVAVVIGGGSGHYPAFGGLVGPGLAHGAAMGNIFASPSALQVDGVARAAHEGRGVLLTFGNYAGDVLHFGQAQQRLRDAGIDCRTVCVTDDVWSAPKSEIHNRRGIAGDLVVFKIAGAAAEAGYDLDGVESAAVRANSRTRSAGVAFASCTLPGATEPLFRVPPGRMAIGLGIHGEPGMRDVNIPSAEDLAAILVNTLLDELPEGVELPGARVVPVVNGLGSMKYEELFVLFGKVNKLLNESGAVVVEPEVGEYCTSFDMAGVSLTLFWLDEELEALWSAPCDTPAYRRGAVEEDRITAPSIPELTGHDTATERIEVSAATDASKRVAGEIARALRAAARMMDEQSDYLGRLDRVAGDGDHGIGMQRGSRAAAEAAVRACELGAGAGTTLQLAGLAWADKGGGTSGAMWGEMLAAMGAAFGDSDPVTPDVIGGAVAAMTEAVVRLGGAKLGDKTMVDAIIPFTDALRGQLAADASLFAASRAALDGAKIAAEQTADMHAGLGRARSHGERSRGTPDPGAVSFTLVTAAVLDSLGVR